MATDSSTMLPLPTEPLTPEVVTAATAGDRMALRAVLAHLMTWLPASARRQYGNNLDPEELCQDAFTVVVRRMDSLKNPERLDAWVQGILRRVAADHLKKRRRRPKVPVEDVELVAALGPDLPMPRSERRSPEADAWRREAMRIGEQVLSHIDPEAREAYILHLEGWSQTEIAGLCEIPRGTAASRIRRAKRTIREVTLRQGLRKPEPGEEGLL